MCLPPSPEGFERRNFSSSCAARPIAWCSITSWSEEPACIDPSEAIFNAWDSAHSARMGSVLYQLVGGLLVALPVLAIAGYFWANPDKLKSAVQDIWDAFNGGPPQAS